MKKLVIALLMVLLFFSVYAGSFDKGDQHILFKSVKYLTDIPEVSWIEVEQNDVYIGWNSIPSDFDMINRFAAMIGNRAINFGVHVWSIQASKKGWRPGDSSYLFHDNRSL